MIKQQRCYGSDYASRFAQILIDIGQREKKKTMIEKSRRRRS